MSSIFKVGYVVFRERDRNLPYVVNLQDVTDLPPPKSYSDFDPEKKYKVKWVKSDLSKGLSSDLHPALIKCIARKYLVSQQCVVT